MVIDLHCHFYPRAFLKALSSLDKRYGFTLREENQGKITLFYEDNILTSYTPAFYDLDHRLKVSEEGVDIQVLSLVQPGIFWADIELAIDLCQVVNDELSSVSHKYPDRFLGIASVPLQRPERATDELERAVLKLGLRGALMGTNVNGEDLDSPVFFPFYERAESLNIPIFIHPFSKPQDSRFRPYKLGPVLDFMFENTVAIVKLIFGGVLKRFPKLKFCFPHLGGAFPYLMGRVSKAYRVYEETRVNISEPPETFLQLIYLDTASFNPHSMDCALSHFGIKQFVFGTDYPFSIGEPIGSAVRQIMEYSSITDEEKQMILAKNPLKLLGSAI